MKLKRQADAVASALLEHLEERREEMAAGLRALVEMESPSQQKQAVDRLGHYLASQFEGMGARVTLHRREDFGDHLQADFAGPGKPVLLLGHIDTVWDLGTLERMPCRVENGRLYGPGTFDMKGGVAQMLFALAALQQVRGRMPRAVTALLVSDEEVGSGSSRAVTERLARESAAVLVLEPSAGAEGALKTSRKGVGGYHIKVTGKASHSGLDFLSGQSAVLELARQIVKVSGFTDLKRGLTVNVGVIRGGTRTNVVPAEASAEMDVRIARLADGRGIDKKIRGLKPFNRKCRVEVTGAIDRPPLERSQQVAALFAQAQKIAASLGWKLAEKGVGGGSDGNFTAALGIPTLDGLGAVGDGAHAVNEHVVLAEMPRRAALVARLIETV